MYTFRDDVMERRVRNRLLDWFGRELLDYVERVDPDCYRVRLTDGGTALAIVEEDGSVTIRELDSAWAGA